MKYFIFVLPLLFIFSCGTREKYVDKDKLLGNDYRLFQLTPAWDLAKAVSEQDTISIKKLILDDKIDINFQEPKFGQTLLMLAVVNQQLTSFETLLKLGADPSIHDSYDGASAIIDAAGFTRGSVDDIKIMNLLLKYGANPNDEETGPRREDNTQRNTPLIKACSQSVGKVKLLVDAGANINYRNEFGVTALSEAYLLDKYEIVLYLLEEGANYKIPIVSDDNGDRYLVDMLRDKLLPLGTKEYELKMKIIDFLKNKGIDYRKAPIPESIIKKVKENYPRTWKEYLEKY